MFSLKPRGNISPNCSQKKLKKPIDGSGKPKVNHMEINNNANDDYKNVKQEEDFASVYDGNTILEHTLGKCSIHALLMIKGSINGPENSYFS